MEIREKRPSLSRSSKHANQVQYSFIEPFRLEKSARLRMASQAATSDTVCQGISDEALQNVQRRTQEPGTSHIAELLKEQSVAWIKCAIDAPIWSGTAFSYEERLTLLMSSCRDAARNLSSEPSKGCCATINHAETNTEVQPIHGGIEDGLEPIISNLSSHSKSSVENGLHSASLGAIAPKIASSGRQRETRGRKRPRIMPARIRRSRPADDDSLSSTTNPDDELLSRHIIVPCELIRPLTGEGVPCRALLDTGAQVSVMKESLAISVLGKDYFKSSRGTKVKLEGLGRKAVRPLGKIRCKLQLTCSESTTTTFYVVEDAKVPGLDICLSLSASVDTKHVTILLCEKCNGSTCSR